MPRPTESQHPLLAQVPLTVSPFVSLPTATTLPYTYRPLPSSLPPSTTVPPDSVTDSASSRSDYVISSSGRAAHPRDIIASCQALQKHLQQLRTDAQSQVLKWEADVERRELAEKRRVAPGWLDRKEKILQPARAREAPPTARATAVAAPGAPKDRRSPPETDADDETGNELDRMFGAMKT